MVLVSVLILIGGVVIMGSTSQNSAQVSASQNAKVFTIDPTSKDFGSTKYDAKPVKKSFRIKNTGTDTLKLFNIKTSCHCTKANLTVDEIEGPSFGMSGISSWVGEIKPGKEAILTAIFDPAYHGIAGVGPVTRFISVDTNDKSNSKLTFTLTGTVIK